MGKLAALSGLMVFALCGSADAQQVMDGSSISLAEKDFSSLKKIMSRSLHDPYGSQIEELKLVAPNRVCGRINAKNAYGAFIGFRPFAADIDTGRLFVAPNTINSENVSTEQLNEWIDTLKSYISICGDKER